MRIGSRIWKQALTVAIAAAGLAGCVAYPEPGYYGAAPGYYAAPVSGTVVIEGGGRGGEHRDHDGDRH